MVLAFCGAVLIAANVAPTEEIIMLAVEIAPWRLLGLALFSITSERADPLLQRFPRRAKSAADRWIFAVFFGAVITYAVALIASAMLLWFFGSFDGFALITCLARNSRARRRRRRLALRPGGCCCRQIVRNSAR